MKALVLSGGGAKGSYEAGVACTLIREYGEQFDIFCGTSIGAINAAFLAQDDTDALEALWKNIAQSKIVAPLPRILTLQRIFESFIEAHAQTGLSGLRAWMSAIYTTVIGLRALHPLTSFSSMTGLIDPTNTKQLLAGKLHLEALKHVLITTATDLLNATAEVFCYFPEGYLTLEKAFQNNEPDALAFCAADFAETIRASGAIPGAFSPVDVLSGTRNGAYVDGGVANNTPIGQAINAGAQEITVIYLDPLPSKSTAIVPPQSIPEVLLGCFSIMQQRLLALDYQMAIRVNDAVGANANDTHDKNIIRLRTFRPITPLRVGVLDFDKQAAVDAAFTQGQTDARTASLRLSFAS